MLVLPGKRILSSAIAAGCCLALAACANSTPNAGSGSTPTTPGGTSSEQGEIETPDANVEDFATGHPEDVFAMLEQWAGLTEAGEGKVAILLPDAAFSNRWVTADEPGFERAFAALGLAKEDVLIYNAKGSPSDQIAQAEQAITAGASVILMTNLDSGSGAAIQANATASGVAVIDYDRLTVNGEASYYVSFDNENVGRKMGDGLVACIDEWGVEDPQILELQGSPTDNNAALVKVGYQSALKPLYDSGEAVQVQEIPTENWDNQVALKNFEQAYSAHPEINVVATYNDGIASAVISALKNNKIPPRTVPTTGQDADLTALQSVLEGYQCMTVYKPIYRETAAAALLAIYLRAGVEPPDSLFNGEYDADSHLVTSVLLEPEVVTAENMQDTVVRDEFVDVEDLCTGDFAALCAEHGIG